MNIRLVALILLPLAMCLSCSSSDGQPAGSPRLVERTHASMGAEAHLTAWTTDEAGVVAAFNVVFTELERLESLMTVWREDSDISRLNRAAGSKPIALHPDVIDVLGTARRASDWTGGAFDVTFGALSGIWKFDHDQDDRIPTPEQIAERLPFVGYQGLEIDESARTAVLTRAGMRAHLGGIGKGFAVERAATILRARGFHDFMIQFGGDLYVGGTRGDRSWRLGIRDPRGPAERSFAAIDLTNSAFSTSGDYERFFIRNGKRYHHILDPRTGEPARGCRSVTIVAKSATLADALSTGVFVLGPQAGMELIERLPDVEGVIVGEDNRVLVSSGLQGRLQVIAQPTDGT